MPQKPWSPLTHSLYRWCQDQNLASGSYGVAISGGRDSMLLAEVLLDIASALKFELHFLHCHHGRDGTQSADSSLRFRDEALGFCQTWSQQRQVKFHSVVSETPLASEAEMRDFRRQNFANWRTELGIKAVFLGHHGQDLLETRLLRLIRGTGGQGFLAMREAESTLLRPWLGCTNAELDSEAKSRSLVHVTDPTNSHTEYLRNWLREDWLPRLEAKSPGSLKTLAQSFEILVQEIQSANEHFPPEGLFLDTHHLSSAFYLQLSRVDQKRTLALFIHGIKGRDYSLSQIEEVQKRLDKSQNEHTFTVAGLNWQVNSYHIRAQSSV